MALGALLATLGYAAHHAHLHSMVGRLYVGAIAGVILFVVGLVEVIRGR